MILRTDKPDLNPTNKLTPPQNAALDEQIKAVCRDWAREQAEAERTVVYRLPPDKMRDAYERTAAPLVKGGQGRPDLSPQQASERVGVVAWATIALAIIGIVSILMAIGGAR